MPGTNNSIFGNFPLLNKPVTNAPNPNGSGIPNNSPVQSALNILGPAVGAGLTAYGQGQQQQQDRLTAANNLKAQTAENQLQSDRNFGLTQATSAANADPLGADQKFAQRNAILGQLLTGARNFNVTPGDPSVAGAMGKTSGGLQLPTGGLDPAMINRLFGDAATQASIAQRAKEIGHIDPNAPAPDLASMYGNSADGSQNAFTTDIQNSNNAALTKQNTDLARQRQIIQNAIDENIRNANKGSSKAGIFGAIAGGLMQAAPYIAAAF